MKNLYLTFLIFFSIFKLSAQNEFIIKDVKLFDGENTIDKTSVWVKDKLIIQVSDNIQISEDIEAIDGKNKTLIPALSNAHVHAWSSASLNQAAKAGVLNVMDMHGIETFQQNMRNLKDSTNYARYYVAGFAATVPNGHGTQFGFAVPTLVKPESAKKFINNRKKSNVDYIKIIVEPSMETLSIETTAELIKEAHIHNLKAVVHVSRLEDAIEVIKKNADGLVHLWWDKVISQEKLKQLKHNHDFFVIPTLLTTLRAFNNLGEKLQNQLTEDQLLKEIKKLHDIGIPILAGTDPPNFNINYGTDLYEELFLFKKAGLSNEEILKSATINVARAFDLERTGLIKSGYVADIILVNGDPINNLEDLKNIDMVWKAGNQVEK